MAFFIKNNFMKKTVTVFRAVSMPLKETVFGVGYVGAEIVSDVSTQVSGKIQRTPVTEGALVSSGEVLIMIDDSEFKNSLDAAGVNLQKTMAQLELVRTNISQIRENIAIAQSNKEKSGAVMEYNRKETGRYKTLLDSSQVAQKAYDEKQMAYTVSDREYNNALTTLRILSIDKEKQTAAEKSAEADVENSKIAIKQAELKCEYSSIRAPFDGIIIRRFAEEGMVVNSGSPVMRLVKKGSYWVSSFIDISQMRNIKVGQSAGITLNRQPDVKYSGKVHRIEQEGDKVTEELKVDILFDSNIQNLYLDEKAEVHIETASKNASAIPVKCIVSRNGASGVFILNDSRTVFKKIKTGISDKNGFTEIIEGVTDKDAVVYFEEMQKLADNESVVLKKEGL